MSEEMVQQLSECLIKALDRRGLSRSEAERVINAAGPELCFIAIEWSEYVFISKYRPLTRQNAGWYADKIPFDERPFAAIDALDCMLSGVISRGGFDDVERTKQALRAFDIEPPEISAKDTLLAILRGAHEFIIAKRASIERNGKLDPIFRKMENQDG